MKNIKEEIRELEQQPLVVEDDGVRGYSPEVRERLRYLKSCDPAPVQMYPPTMPMSNGCSVRGCDRLLSGLRGYRDLCGDHAAAEVALGR